VYSEAFKDSISSTVFLFSASLGSIDFTVFDNNSGMIEYDNFPMVGKIYLMLWLVVTNIMLLNLLIAMFSNTYNQLEQEGNGLFLIEIINNRP
jgi:hypothetical protein